MVDFQPDGSNHNNETFTKDEMTETAEMAIMMIKAKYFQTPSMKWEWKFNNSNNINQSDYFVKSKGSKWHAC